VDLRVDRLTGETYDADIWYRGAGGLWHNRIAEKEHAEKMRKLEEERRAKRNASRVAKGKRRRSPSSFRHSSARYDQYLREDSGLSFGEWLKDLKYRRRY